MNDTKMDKSFRIIALLCIFLQVLACGSASSIAAGDTNALNVNSISLRIKNELKNAELEAAIGRVTIESRIKQSRNTIMMHVQESKTHLKASKDFLKPNGMYINVCVSNATTMLEQLPVDTLNQCSKYALSSVNMLISELRMLEIETRKIIFFCHVNSPDLNTCVQSSIDDVTERMEQIRQAVRDAVDKIRNDTCISTIENEIYEELSDLLNDFAKCLENELVE